MLKVKPFRQKTGFCGPASLKMVLDYFGVRKTENYLARLSGATKNLGATGKNLLRAAQKLGLKGFIMDFSKISDVRKYVLKKRIPVIVDWFSQDEGHYSVAVKIDRKNIYLQDPELGRIRKLDLETFKRVWFDFSGNFLKSKNDIIIRRMIVIYKKR
jgi:predicted double-glycine peptidase